MSIKAISTCLLMLINSRSNEAPYDEHRGINLVPFL